MITVSMSTGYVTQIAFLYPVPTYSAPVYEDVFNPKMWAQWFREFLQEYLPQRREAVQAVGTVRTVVAACARSRPLRQREWKMKLWKQAL